MNSCWCEKMLNFDWCMQTDCFICIAIAKHRWLIKLRWSKIRCQINQEILKPSKNDCNSFSTNVSITGKNLLREFYSLFYLQFCDSSDQWKNPVWQKWEIFERYFYMKIIVTIIPTDVVTNLLLSSFCPFLPTKIKSLVFSKLVFW